jgi:hypothetical protein
MASKRPPEYIITDNPHGIMFFGPGGPQEADDGTQFRLAVASNSTCKYLQDGAKVEHIQGRYHITCGNNLQQNRDKAPKEQVAFSVNAKTGDLVFSSPSGNIKFLCKNMYIETRGDKKTNGCFMVTSNGAVVVHSGEQLTLTGTKVCLKGSAEVNIVTDHFINFVGDVQKGGSPLSSILQSVGVPSIFADLVTGVTESCR